ncbi:MAG: hypothetical protein AB2693_26120 [Candidatus Thiodiazotropha sp.]
MSCRTKGSNQILPHRQIERGPWLREICGANGWAGIDSPAKAGSPLRGAPQGHFLRGAFDMLGVLRRCAPCRTKGSN